MALITPITTLPNYTVDKLADSDGQSRQREKRKDKEQETLLSQKDLEKNQESVPPDSSSTGLPLEFCQQLDTETTVKLLDEQVKSPNQKESPYENVKNLTSEVTLVREI